MEPVKQNRIAVISQRFAFICLIGILLLPLIPVLIWGLGSEKFLLSGEAYLYLVPKGVSFDRGLLTPEVRLAGFVISMIPMTVVISGLWQLRKLFIRFSKMEVFSCGTVRQMRLVALHLIAIGTIMPMSGALMSLATSFSNPPGLRVISITLGGGELASLFIGAVFLAISWVLVEGKKLADENQQFV